MSRRSSGRSRLVYSTDKGDACPRCGWSRRDCRCDEARVEPVPERVEAKLRLEKSGRKGKAVTVVDGLPRNPDFLKTLAKQLKQRCASGGSAGEDRVEVQGDHRDAVRELLRGKGWTVKG